MNADESAIIERVRRLQPTRWQVVNSLVIALAGIGFATLIVMVGEDRRHLPSFVAFPLTLGFGWFGRFLEQFFLRLRINRLLADCGASVAGNVHGQKTGSE